MHKISNKKLKTMHIVYLSFVILFAAMLSFTGAWYFAHGGSFDIDMGDLDMGSVTLDKDVVTMTSKSKSLDSVKLLPTMQIDISEITYNGNVNAYYKIEVTSSEAKNSAGQSFTGTELSTLQNILSQATVYNAVTPNGKIQAQSITIPETLNNTYQGASAKLTVTITVIQQPNLSDAMTPEAAQSAFEQVGM